MKKLEVFQIGHNNLREIPPTFSKLLNLKTLSLQSNKITTFPTCLCELKNLDAVDLSGNRLEELPENIETLQVVELNMNRNKLKSLPDSLNACPRLKVLRLEENLLKLSSITSEFLINSQVSLLAVEGNLFQMKELYQQDGYDKVGWFCSGLGFFYLQSVSQAKLHLFAIEKERKKTFMNEFSKNFQIFPLKAYHVNLQRVEEKQFYVLYMSL